MTQETPSLYKESAGAEVKITATPSDPSIRVLGSLDGSKDKFKRIEVDPSTGTSKFVFDISLPRHVAVLQPVFNFTNAPDAEVAFEVACSHGNQFAAGTKRPSDPVPERTLNFKQ